MPNSPLRLLYPVLAGTIIAQPLIGHDPLMKAGRER
jgi:hypothetical protein